MKPTTTRARARARLCHKVDRLWTARAGAGPMPRRWREVCAWALVFAPKAGGDPKFHRAIVAALGFAKPYVRGQWSSIDAWAKDPANVAALAVDLLPVIRAHARPVS